MQLTKIDYICYMKNLLYLLTLTIFTTGCYQYSEQTYPTLDGTYILRSISVNSTDIVNIELSDDFYDDPMTFIYPNSVGALDTMKINKSRISISGNRMFAGYYLENGGDHWREEYPVSITRDFITGRWVNLNVTYTTPFFNTYRHYLIIEDGLEYLTLECPKQYEDGPYGNEYSYSMTFYREGP